MAKVERNSLLTAPNILSSLRILLVPVFLVMVLQHKAISAFVIFLLAGSTDFFDGLTARIWHQRTKIGSFLDPTADKLLATSAFIVLTIPNLSVPNVIPLWLTVTVISRDIVIVSGVLFMYIVKNLEDISPTLLGKSTIFCQLLVILLVLFFNAVGTSPSYIKLLFQLTLIVTLLSGIHYVYLGIRMLREAKES